MQSGERSRFRGSESRASDFDFGVVVGHVGGSGAPARVGEEASGHGHVRVPARYQTSRPVQRCSTSTADTCTAVFRCTAVPAHLPSVLSYKTDVYHHTLSRTDSNRPYKGRTPYAAASTDGEFVPELTDIELSEEEWAVVKRQVTLPSSSGHATLPLGSRYPSSSHVTILPP
eukprot:3941155-Rhodomonas_salina.4